MVSGERDFAVNAKVSSAAATRLKKLALRRGQSYGEVLDSLLLEVPIDQAEWEQPIADALSRITSLEAQVSALLSASTLIANTESLPDVVDVAPSALEGVLSAVDDQGIDEPRAAEIIAKIAPGAAVDAIERESAEVSSSIPPERKPHPVKKPVKQVISELIASGMRSPTQIARALNEAGYLTQTRTKFARGNQQIRDALDAVKEK